MATNKADRAILFVWSCLLCVCVVWGGGRNTRENTDGTPGGGNTLDNTHMAGGVHT